MWDFISSKNGVAIKTTVGKLEHALAYAHNSPVRKAKPAASSVGYIDHSNYFLEHDGYRSVLAIITESWSYENETRFVANSPSILKLPLKITMNLQPFEHICSPTYEEKQQQLE